MAEYRTVGGQCMHFHGEHGHKAPAFWCKGASNLHSCEDEPHNANDGCPLEPATDAGYGVAASELCALGQEVGGRVWNGRGAGCKAITRLMDQSDVDL